MKEHIDQHEIRNKNPNCQLHQFPPRISIRHLVSLVSPMTQIVVCDQQIEVTVDSIRIPDSRCPSRILLCSSMGLAGTQESFENIGGPFAGEGMLGISAYFLSVVSFEDCRIRS